MAIIEKTCPLLLGPVESETPLKIEDLSKRLENGQDSDKIAVIKEIIQYTINGTDLSRLTMQVFKFCLNSKNHQIKKLLQIYFEVLDKNDTNGKLKPEMILVCNHLLQDLKHANEYIRGSTCRSLCRITEGEILEQLAPQILSNLEHRHSYVRKNAVLSLMSMYNKHSELIPDSPQRVLEFLLNETNILAKRNAFLMLTNCDLQHALNYFLTIQDKISTFPENMQITILELMRKVCRTISVPKSIFVKSALSLLESSSNSVVYEAANTLLALTPLDGAVSRALEAYSHLLQTESDQNVKLIVINRLNIFKRRYERNLRTALIDILRALNTPNIDVRRQILALTLDLASSSNIEDVISVLKKEIINTSNAENNDSSIMTYRNLLVETMHQCAIKFPEVVSTVVYLLMNYLGDENNEVSYEVILFVKEIVEEYSDLRQSILEKLLDSFTEIRSQEVYKVTFWILGEYATTSNLLQRSIEVIANAIGSLPLQTDDKPEKEESKEEKNESLQPLYMTRTVVLDDGTYATETLTTKAMQDEVLNESKNGGTGIISHLRNFVKSGEYYLVSVLASAFVKITLRLKEETSLSQTMINQLSAKAMLILVAILRYGSLPTTQKKIDIDTTDRIKSALHIMIGHKDGKDNVVAKKIEHNAILQKCHENFSNLLKRKREEEYKKREEQKRAEEQAVTNVPFDTLLTIRQIKGAEFSEFDEDDTLNVRRAAGNKSNEENLRTRLNRVHQLTGFADPVYAEACVTVHQFDILLDFLIMNNTKKTLQNLTLELHTSGDLQLVEKPNKVTLGSNSTARVQASIKISSTQNNVIFGNIVYDTTGATTDNNIIVINEIHMDIMDYVQPASCSEHLFREHWGKFEWQNNVDVNTDIQDLQEYLNYLAKITKLQLLTPLDKLSGDCQFIAANFYAISVFGEHVLMNVSIELKEDKKISGHIKIRCKSEGICMSLGEKITNKQKKIE